MASNRNNSFEGLVVIGIWYFLVLLAWLLILVELGIILALVYIWFVYILLETKHAKPFFLAESWFNLTVQEKKLLNNYSKAVEVADRRLSMFQDEYDQSKKTEEINPDSVNISSGHSSTIFVLARQLNVISLEKSNLLNLIESFHAEARDKSLRKKSNGTYDARSKAGKKINAQIKETHKAITELDTQYQSLDREKKRYEGSFDDVIRKEMKNKAVFENKIEDLKSLPESKKKLYIDYLKEIIQMKWSYKAIRNTVFLFVIGATLILASEPLALTNITQQMNELPFVISLGEYLIWYGILLIMGFLSIVFLLIFMVIPNRRVVKKIPEWALEFSPNLKKVKNDVMAFNKLKPYPNLQKFLKVVEDEQGYSVINGIEESDLLLLDIQLKYLEES